MLNMSMQYSAVVLESNFRQEKIEGIQTGKKVNYFLEVKLYFLDLFILNCILFKAHLEQYFKDSKHSTNNKCSTN